MKDKRERIIRKIPLIKQNMFLEVMLYYDIGGMNYFTATSEPRGYYLSVTPVKIEERGNGVTIKGYGAFTGVKKMIKEAKRYSKKVLRELQYPTELGDQMIKVVLRKQELEIKPSFEL